MTKAQFNKKTDSSENPHICTKCDHFICDDIKHLVGHCNELDITRCAGDICYMRRYNPNGNEQTLSL